VKGEDWDDEDAGYPRAPLPPHERTWRHPSELGFVAQQQFIAPRRVSRLAVVGLAAAGVLVTASIGMMLASRDRNVGVEASGAAVDQPGTTLPQVNDAPVTPTHRSVAPSESRPRRSSVAPQQADRRMSTMVIDSDDRIAVAVGDGRHAFTTAGGLSVDQALVVRVSAGTNVAARVISLDPDHQIAVLELEQEMADVARQVAYGTPDDGARVLLGSNGSTATVRISERGLDLEADAEVQEGEPVVDDRGRLVGLASRYADGTPCLLTIPRLAAIRATVLIIDVWLGLTFDTGSLLVLETATASPAAAAGISAGDRLLAIDGKALTSVDDLWLELAGMTIGQQVTLDLDRNGETRSVLVTLAGRPG